MKFEFVETKRHTVESVYGKPEATVLGEVDALKHEATEFRIPICGEPYLTTKPCRVFNSLGCADGPRLILRRKTVKRRVLTETGEVRNPLRGEPYESASGKDIYVASGSHGPNDARRIYRESFIEVEA